MAPKGNLGLPSFGMQQSLNFLPDPQLQGAFLPGFFICRSEAPCLLDAICHCLAQGRLKAGWQVLDVSLLVSRPDELVVWQGATRLSRGSCQGLGNIVPKILKKMSVDAILGILVHKLQKQLRIRKLTCLNA